MGKERCRNLEIEKRVSEWETQENARLTTLHADAKAQSEAREQALAVEKARKCEEFRDECAARAEQQRKDAELNRKRAENIRRKEEERVAKAALKAQELKQDSTAKSQATVKAFAERTVPAEMSLVSVLTQAPVETHYSHFGASVGGIL